MVKTDFQIIYWCYVVSNEMLLWSQTLRWDRFEGDDYSLVENSTSGFVWITGQKHEKLQQWQPVPPAKIEAGII